MKFHIFLRRVRRKWMHSRYGLKYAHPTSSLTPGSSIAKDAHIDEYAYIGPGCIVQQGVSIGKYTMLANNVMIVGGDHNFRNCDFPIIFSGREKRKKTKIGVDCWIGAGSIIMAGVTIGDGAIIAAGSIVTKDIPPYSIYGGNPARFIKTRFDPEDEIKYKEMISSFNYTEGELELMMVSGRDWNEVVE